MRLLGVTPLGIETVEVIPQHNDHIDVNPLGAAKTTPVYVQVHTW